jgi:hypothetical protein
MNEPFEKGVNAGLHVGNVLAAQRDSDQPGATFRAVEAAMGATIGHKLFTILVHRPELAQAERVHSTRPDAYPVGGSRPAGEFPLKRRLVVEGEAYIGRDAGDLREAFSDHDQIFALGCESVLNMPVRWRGQTLGAVNLLHEAYWYSEADVPLARLFAQLALPAILLIARP